MPTDQVSKKTRLEFREHFVGTTLAVITDEFDVADIAVDLEYDPPNLVGERRRLVEQYYHTLDFSKTADVRKFLHVAENVLHELENVVERAAGLGDEAPHHGADHANLVRRLSRDGFQYTDGSLISGVQDLSLDDVADNFGHPELKRQILRMRDAVDNDPGLAIGTAKELIETTCKTILADRGIDPPKGAGIPDLVKMTRKELKLLPADIPEKSKGVGAIRRLLSNLGTVGQGVAELRGLYGTGHGKDGSYRGVPPRVARLAVGSAATLSTFLLETHENNTTDAERVKRLRASTTAGVKTRG